MNRLRRLWARVRDVLHHRVLEHDLDEELRSHLDLLAAEYERGGLSSEEARRRARLRLGGIEQGREIVRQSHGFPSAEAALRDVLHAVRTLAKAPGFSLVTIVTLALGIAVNIAIFSIVDAVILRPLSYERPERLVSIWEIGESGRMSVAPASLADYRRASSFSEIAGLTAVTRNLTGGGQPETLFGEQVTANYFATLRVAPVLGRAFSADDEGVSSSRVVIVSDAFWQRHFAGDPAALGRTIDLDGVPHIVVGVMPPTFLGLFDVISADRRSIWLPAAFPAELLANRGDHEIRLIGRLTDAATVATAAAEFTSISESLAQAYPATNANIRTGMQPLGDDIVRGVKTSMLVLLLTVGLILTIACVNVANLFLARGVARRREISVRFALGASRLRVVTALVAESLVLAALAGIVGAALAVWVQNLLVAVAPQTVPRLSNTAMDVRVLGYAAVVALVTGVLFGIIPAWQAGHARPVDALTGAGRVVAGASVMRWRNALMFAQVVLSTILLVGAGLMVKSLVRLNGVALGFDPARVVAMRLTLPERRYPTAAERLRFFQQLEERVVTLPGVEAVGYANNLPLRGGWGSGLLLDGVSAPGGKYVTADFQAVSPGYFATLGITLADGRLFTADDTSVRTPVAVVSRAFEQRFLSGDRALGRQLRRGPEAPLITIIGVVEDVRRDGRTSAIAPQVYLPAAQVGTYPVRLADFAVRAHGAPLDLVPALRAAVWAIDAEQPISNVRTLDDLLLAGSADRRFQALLFSLFAVLALVLASVGTYGVVAYVVTQRTPEIGVRMALGASVASIYRWILTQTLTIVATGALAGLAGARWLSQYVSTLLFEVSVGDPISYIGAALSLVSVAIAATALAGRRATAIDPTQALRYE